MSPVNLVVLPILVPLAAGILSLVLGKRVGAQRALLPFATAGLLAAASALFFAERNVDGPLEMHFGSWEAPVGISFGADAFSTLMVLVSAIVAFAGALFALGEIGASLWRRHYAFFYLLLLAGINGAFLTQDLFNLFVWFEVMLMASFALMVLGRRRNTFQGATKYVVINVAASFFFLSGLGILYGKTGSLALADVAAKLADSGNDPFLLSSAALLLIAFGTKAGVFPLFFWLPASYPQIQFTTAAVFGGLLTKVGVYALFRVFGGAFAFLDDFLGPLFLVIGAATMVAGVLGAASQFHVRRILSFHIVSQIGYLVLGLGLFTQGAFAAAIFYTVHHILVKTNLFFAAGLITRAAGSERLERVGGVLRSHPFLAVLFAVPALSLAGIPPLSGFVAKFLVIREAFRAEAFVWGGIALAVGFLTLFSMVKVWNEAFWKNHPGEATPARFRRIQYLPVAALAILTILIGLLADPVYRVALDAAAVLAPATP